MTLVVLSVVVTALLVAVLAVSMGVLGMLLSRIADNLDDCSKNVQRIARYAHVIGPAVQRINHAGRALAEALPQLSDGAERMVAQLAPAVAAPAGAPTGVGYLDL